MFYYQWGSSLINWIFVPNFSNIFTWYQNFLDFHIFCIHYAVYTFTLQFILLQNIKRFKSCPPIFNVLSLFEDWTSNISWFFFKFFKIFLLIFQGFSNFFKCVNTIFAQGPVRGPINMLVKALSLMLNSLRPG